MLTVPVLAFADHRQQARFRVGGGSAAAGGSHSILSLPDGRVLTWGKGAQGQLGLGDARSRRAPTSVDSLHDITMVAAGRAHSLARSSSGRVYAWGANGAGQLGDGTIAPRRRPVEVLLLSDVISVAAGRAHSLALTADGRVLAWGANDRGQLGNGSTIDNSIPTEITALSDVVAIAAGHSHSLAVTRSGALFAWGGNDHGQLGNGSRDLRLTPVRLSIGPVVAVAAGRSHTLALLSNGDVYSWGRGTFGQLGTGSTRVATVPALIAGLKAIAIEAGAHFSAAVRADRVLVTWGANRLGQLGDGTRANRLHPVEVRGLTGISAIALGDTHVITVTSDGALWTWGDRTAAPVGTYAGLEDWAAPLGTLPTSTIEPAGGLYDAPQTVTVEAAGHFFELRYSTDGSDPTPESALYLGPIVVATTTTVRARAFSIFDGSAGGVSTAVFAFHYGQLSPPAVSPSGGTYARAPQVAMTALPGATIRYTLNGDDPSDASSLYSAPIQIPAAGALLKARAFHVDWSASAVVAEAYVTDVTPPTIAAEVTPPLVDGWMTTPVTVTFVCQDDSGQVTCPAPVVVDQDGRDQLIRGVATDPAGNQASASVVVSVDLRPPSIEIVDSPDQQSRNQADIAIHARVTDAGSGVVDMFCNGEAAAVSAELTECGVRLRPGVNSIIVQATDAVGHVGSVGLTVTRVGIPSSVAVSPAQRAMLVGQVATFSLRDDFGAVVTGARWSSSDDSVIALSTDDPPWVTAIGVGTAIVTAVKDGLSGTADVVVHAGNELAPGTLRWTFKTTPGFQTGFPIFTTPADAAGPDLFAVETRTPGEATLHALTFEGEALWREESPGIPLMGDAFGGVIAGILDDVEEGTDYKALVRLGRGGGVPPWRYHSRGLLQAPAQAANGTIYATEYIDTGLRNSDGSRLWEKYVVILDGRTGARIDAIRLERERTSFVSQNDGSSGCRSTNVEKPAQTVGPVVDADGRAYLLVRRLRSEQTDICNEPVHFRAARTIDVGVDVIALTPGQPVATYPVYAARCTSPAGGLVACDAPVTLHQLVPDGIGGVLAKWERPSRVQPPSTLIPQMLISRLAGDGSVVDQPVVTHTWLYSVGQAGTAYLLSIGGYTAMDVASWTPRWTASLGAFVPLAAHPDGGLAVQHAWDGTYQTVTSSGQLDPSTSMPLPLEQPFQMFGSWIGRGPEGLRAVAGEFPDATRWHLVGGNAQRSWRVSTPGVGIFAKSHAVQEPVNYQHVSIRITPTFQEFWKQLKPADFVNKDEYGNYFMTIGAGTAEGDTSFFCIGALTKGINREKDVAARPVNFEQLPVGPFEELRLINDFYVYFGNYKNDLPYACVPEMHPGKYNSNSFAHGLLRKAGAPIPVFPNRGKIPPGWSVPVPPDKFNP